MNLLVWMWENENWRRSWWKLKLVNMFYLNVSFRLYHSPLQTLCLFVTGQIWGCQEFSWERLNSMACDCSSIHLSVRPNLSEHVSSQITMTFYHIIENAYRLWYPIFKFSCQISRSHKAKTLNETGQISGFWAFSVECMGGMAWNLICWCILTTFRTDYILVTVC